MYHIWVHRVGGSEDSLRRRPDQIPPWICPTRVPGTGCRQTPLSHVVELNPCDLVDIRGDKVGPGVSCESELDGVEGIGQPRHRVDCDSLIRRSWRCDGYRA